MKENVMHFGMTHTGLEHFYRNEIDFPVLAKMDKANILIVERIKSWSQEGNEFIFQTEAQFYEKKYFYRFMDYRPTYEKLNRCRNIAVKLSLWSNDIVRIQAKQGYTVENVKSEMLIGCPSKVNLLDVEETECSVVIETPNIKIIVSKDPWNIEIQDSTGHTFFKQFKSVRDENSPVMRFEHCPFGYLYDTQNNKYYSSEVVEYQYDEHFYGFGEKFSDLDKRGQNIDLYNTNCLSVNTVRSYKNIPFFMSTENYGLFIHTSNAINCNMGQHFNKAYCILSDDPCIDYFVIHGDSLKQVLARYTDLTGKTPMLPKWSFGFWISKISYHTREQVEAVEKKLRERKIPCDVICLDNDTYENRWAVDFKFSETRFNKPSEMIKEAKEKGFRIVIWHMPYIETSDQCMNPVYEEGFKEGYFAIRQDGSPDFEHGLIDVSNPKAVEWYQEKLLRPMLEQGVAGVKSDFGESIPNFYYYAGCDSNKMHNLYALLYNKAVYEIAERVYGEGKAVIFGRSAWAGSQRYPLHWGGDPDADMFSLATSIKGGLSFGLSGFPFWAHDIGGFMTPTTPEIYARWMEVGCFSSHCRTHGIQNREPWAFGEETENITRKYLSLRYRLLPYIYSQAYKCTKTSLPMLRALILEYQEDRNVYDIDSEYLFGDSILVAPIFDNSDNRAVYLPEGTWTNYWTDEKTDGGKWINVHAPLDTLPLYVKENAIIPYGPDILYTDQVELKDITWHLYPEKGYNEFVLFEADNEYHISFTCDEKAITINTNTSPFNNRFVIHNVPAESVSGNGETIFFKLSDNTVSFTSNASQITVSMI